ncbi:MAG: arsenic efflux protein [Clostridia bacterium]|nr:arsenic efflux protein [Clostridia bacterium]
MDFHTFLHVVQHSLLDTLKLLPFLALIYVLIELMERKSSLAGENSRLSGNLGVLIGSATGLIPQCGFSVMAAKLYDKGFIALGTLIAIFISTSDEAFIILLSSGQGALSILPMILIKIIVGVSIGYAVNAVYKRVQKRKGIELNTFTKADKADYHARIFTVKDENECTSCGRSHNEQSPFLTYFVFPVLHSLKIAVYVFLVTFAFGLLVEWIGEDAVMQFMHKNVYVQPFITSFIGLIPNCASSVVITQSYLLGGITFGSCVAGLCANAGLGFVVLLKNTKKYKRNLILLFSMYAIAVCVGLLCNALQPVLQSLF